MIKNKISSELYDYQLTREESMRDYYLSKNEVLLLSTKNSKSKDEFLHHLFQLFTQSIKIRYQPSKDKPTLKSHHISLESYVLPFQATHKLIPLSISHSLTKNRKRKRKPEG